MPKITLGCENCGIAIVIEYSNDNPYEPDEHPLCERCRPVHEKPTVIKELSTVAKLIKLLEDSAATLKKNPYAMERIMGEIDTFWGIETGRLEPRCDNCDGSGCPTCDPQDE